MPKTIIQLAPLFILWGCPSTNGVAICNHLANIGCPQSTNCASTYDQQQGHITDFKPDCLMAAQTPEQAEACKSVYCK